MKKYNYLQRISILVIILLMPYYLFSQSAKFYRNTRILINSMTPISKKDGLDVYNLEDLLKRIKKQKNNTDFQTYCFTHAIKSSKYSLVLQLIENGIRPFDERFKTNLEIIAFYTDRINKYQSTIKSDQLIPVLERIAKYSTNINVQDGNGNTSLHDVMLINNANLDVVEDLIKLLLENGIDVSIKNFDGKTACELAYKSDIPEVRENVALLNNNYSQLPKDLFNPIIENDIVSKYCVCDVTNEFNSIELKTRPAGIVKQSVSDDVEDTWAHPEITLQKKFEVNGKAINQQSVIILKNGENSIEFNFSATLTSKSFNKIYKYSINNVDFSGTFPTSPEYFYYILLDITFSPVDINSSMQWAAMGKYIKGGKVGYATIKIIQLPKSGQLTTKLIFSKNLSLSLK